MNKRVTSLETAASAEATAAVKAAKKPARTSRTTRKPADTTKPASQVVETTGRAAVHDSDSQPPTSAVLSAGATREVIKSNRTITAQERWSMISESAYYRAERRGFLGGNPADDWAAAEAEIDAELARTNTVVKP
ncbi:MAG: DUF2934 domain-containing protein [Gammaproteobacteria bacterium]